MGIVLTQYYKADRRAALCKYQHEIDSDCCRILVCNNACWAIGEIAICAPEQVIQSFVVIINTLPTMTYSIT